MAECLYYVWTSALIAVISMIGQTSGQEGAEVPPVPPGAAIARAEVYNITGYLVNIPPVPLAFTYPGPLPIPGVSWPMMSGTKYIAEGRFPYNGYVGTQSAYLQNINYINQPRPYRRRRSAEQDSPGAHRRLPVF
ncbi:hypothetical protein BV898_07618 [Hypsibius exemplaris]|uniref:Uncharacterized protein n=1 Tax=Hypsibius exemplaris TaxID=2072580 RepID=A0A1W0WTA4_HYPEX|nr:hypothetical protein BV898_07618 [Hypsibius exemplaris]